MLITFFDKQGVFFKEFVPEGQTVNSAFHVEVIRRLLKRISWVRPQFRAEDSWFLLHDNSPSHSALVVKTFLAKHGVVEISHPPYSPDLAAADFFLFPMVKTALKGKGFQDVEDIKKNMMAKLNAVPLEAFADCFKKLLNATTNVFK
jgi:histone-lysine N-methyltransferase SETMAR